MKTHVFSAALGACALAGLASIYGFEQEQTKLDAPGLEKLIKGLGYEVKNIGTEAGKEKFEFVVNTTDFKVPMGAELSPSKSFIWLTVFLGKSKTATEGTAGEFRELLIQNGKVQPCLFYITSMDNLMLALPVDNVNVSPTQFKARIDKLSGDVGKSSVSWKPVIKN